MGRPVRRELRQSRKADGPRTSSVPARAVKHDLVFEAPHCEWKPLSLDSGIPSGAMIEN